MSFFTKSFHFFRMIISQMNVVILIQKEESMFREKMKMVIHLKKSSIRNIDKKNIFENFFDVTSAKKRNPKNFFDVTSSKNKILKNFFNVTNNKKKIRKNC